jgi:hypothetical protein
MHLVLNHLLNQFVFEFHLLTFYFYIKYGPYFFYCQINLFFQFHPFKLDFYIRFDPLSFNYNVFDLESFIRFFSFKFIHLHLIFILDLVHIILIMMYLVLNLLLN